jgi:DNA-binding HxlR family transcriptional regulator
MAGRKQSSAKVATETSAPPSVPLVVKSGDGAPERVDRLIHEPIRLGILCALTGAPSLSFNELKKLLDTTDGNLSVHARKLEDAGYIACTKRFEGRLPKTEYSLTDAGKRALEDYVNHMEAVIQNANRLIRTK